jgi:hypothetical protein
MVGCPQTWWVYRRVTCVSFTEYRSKKKATESVAPSWIGISDVLRNFLQSAICKRCFSPVKIVKLRLKILNRLGFFKLWFGQPRGLSLKEIPQERFRRSTNDANTGKVWGLDVEGLLDKNSYFNKHGK